MSDQHPANTATGRELQASDEVTMRLTISGLYSAERGCYPVMLPDATSRLATDDELAQQDRDCYDNREISLHDMISWFDDTSDVTVVIEPDTSGSAEDHYQRKLHRAAKLVGVGDGGEYWSDWEDRARQIRHHEQTLSDARDAVAKALDAHPDDLTALALAAALGVRP